MTRRAVMSPREQQGLDTMIRDRAAGAVARIAHVHPQWPNPGGIPTPADIAALVESTGDPRWVNVTGDAMTGLLTNPVGVSAGLLNVGNEAGSVIAIRVLGTTGTGTGYIGFYPDATSLAAIGARNGYIGQVANNLHLIGEGTSDLRIGTAGATRYAITNAGVHQWDGGSMIYDPTLDMLAIGPSPVESIRFMRAANAPFAAFYDTTGVTRYGYLQMGSASGTLSMDAVAPMLFRTSAAERMRIEANGLVTIGKGPSNQVNVAGAEFNASGGPGSEWLTHDSATVALLVNKIDTGVASGAVFASFRLTNSQIGSITRNAATSAVLYNQTSHGPFKGNVRDLDPDEAMDRVLRWRPVAFQWKYGPDGLNAEDGEPSGDVVHGFIAQEMVGVNPQAVTPGRGTEAEHREWLVKMAEYEQARERYAEVEHERGLMELAYSAEVEAHRVEQARILSEWQPVTERVTDDGLVVVETHDEPPTPEPDPEPPILPDLPALPEHPGEDPFTPWMADWTQNVPDLAAAMRGLIRDVRQLRARVAELEGDAA